MTLLISGGSSGIGLATAELFVHKGYRVYELSRSGKSHEGIEHLSGDVTRPEDCQRAVIAVLEKEKSIDLLICNAGMGVSGSVEFCEVADAHRQMDVNFFGVINLIRAVLPSMRQNRQGRIVLVSSVASIFSIPFQSYYSASKAALNAVAMSLRNEVAPFGIQVGLLLPGDVKSGFTNSRIKSQTGSEIYPHMQTAVATMEQDEDHGHSTEHVAQRLYSLSQQRFLPLYNYEGWWYHLLVIVARFCPSTFVNWVVGKLY